MGVGTVAAAVAAVLVPGHSASAAAQDYPAFVLVAGLLLVGLAAEGDGLFRAAGEWLAGRTGSDLSLVLWGSGLVGVVSAILNLDTAAAFLTPVMVHAGRHRPAAGPPLLYAGLLMSNAGSLLLPGSNLTNLIVLGGRSPGHRFPIHMGLAWIASLVATTLVLAWWYRAGRSHRSRPSEEVGEASGAGEGAPVWGLGLVGVAAAVVLMVALGSPALPVAAVGAALTGVRLFTRRVSGGEAARVLDAPVLIGLLGVAVGLGALGRTWQGLSRLLGHLTAWGSAGLAALSSVVVNNLPAASILSSRPPTHPYALLVGLDLGPNLLASGSLAWVIWFSAARRAGARPSLWQASRLGAPAALLSMAVSVGLLVATGAS